MSLQRKSCAVLAMLFAIARFGFAQRQPEALDVLKKVESTYRSMKTFRAEGSVSIETAGQGMQQKMDMPMTLTMVPPNKLRVENKAAPMNMLMIFNGETLWMYLPLLNKYAKMDPSKFAPDQKLDAKAFPGVSSFAAQYAEVAKRAKGAKILREEPILVDGRDINCFVLQVESEPLPTTASAAFGKSMPNIELSARTLWVDKGRYLVLRESSETKMTFPNATAPMQSKQTVKFSKITVDEPVSDDQFVFTPPEGATEMDLTQFLPKAPGAPK